MISKAAKSRYENSEYTIKKWCCINPKHWMIELGVPWEDLPPKWHCMNCEVYFRCN